jgi:hypothetical protein
MATWARLMSNLVGQSAQPCRTLQRTAEESRIWAGAQFRHSIAKTAGLMPMSAAGSAPGALEAQMGVESACAAPEACVLKYAYVPHL